METKRHLYRFPFSPPSLSLQNDKSSWSPSNLKKSDSLEYLPGPTSCSTPKTKTTTQRPTLLQLPVREPTNMWMKEIRSNYFPECTSTLQSKSLTSDLLVKVKLLASLTKKVINVLHRQTFEIAKEFDHLYRCLETNSIQNIHELVDNLVHHMIRILVQHAQGNCDLSLYQQILKLSDPALGTSHLPDLIWKINAIALDFSKVIDLLLLQQIEILVDLLTSKDSPEATIAVLYELTTSGLVPEHLGNLLARCKGISLILELSITSKDTLTRTTALKLLATVCCAPSAINSFKTNGGIERVCQRLSSSDYKNEEEIKGLVSVLAQVTGPWMKYNIACLNGHKSSLIRLLTGEESQNTPFPIPERRKKLINVPSLDLLQTSENQDLVLLSAVTLANLSYATETVEDLVQSSSLRTLLAVIRSQGSKAVIFLKEQAATLIANLANHQQYITYLCEARVIPALLCFLSIECNSTLHSAVEAASYRLQYKSAIALAKICREKEAIVQIIELQGVARLIKLCKGFLERNQQDRIFHACLEALKQIIAYHNSNASEIKALDLDTKNFVINELKNMELDYTSTREMGWPRIAPRIS